MLTTRARPPALQPGDTVAVVAPAAAIERSYLERGVGVLSALGFRVRVSERALARDGILAGTDQERAAELTACFADPEVRGIFAARAGYGCGRLLPLLDFDLIARSPKVFVGFSDATFILNTLVERASMVSFHGPMVAMDFAQGLSTRSLDHLRRVLCDPSAQVEFKARDAHGSGCAEGELIGGCLSVVVSMLATPYAPDFAGKILFLEDVGEKAYRIDRMLVQLRQCGALGRVAGIAFGGIRAVAGDEDEERLIARFIAEQTSGVSCPVLLGIDCGHGTDNLVIPLGLHASIDASARSLVLAEPAVAASSSK